MCANAPARICAGGAQQCAFLPRLRSFFLPIVFRPYRERYCSLSSVRGPPVVAPSETDNRRHPERGQTPRTQTHTTSHKTAT